jgi:phospholipid/cholesterol/gamma-HCH transport system permease protein
VPQIVAIGMARELGPVLGGLMVAARVAVLHRGRNRHDEGDGTDRRAGHPVDQPDEIPDVPRLLAATLTVPVLVGVGDAIGIMGGWLVGITRLDFNSAAYLKNTVDFLEAWDIGSGLVKGAVFGFLVALMGCYHGMNSPGARKAWGRRPRRRWSRPAC